MDAYSPLLLDGAWPSFDACSLQKVCEELINNQVTSENVFDTSDLDSPIALSEVESAVARAKRRKAAGFDLLPSESLKNSTRIDILLRLTKYSFDNTICPEVWRSSLINLIKKSDTDPRDRLGYHGMSLLSVCKIYSEILNIRFNEWLECNNILADELMGSAQSEIRKTYKQFILSYK